MSPLSSLPILVLSLVLMSAACKKTKSDVTETPTSTVAVPDVYKKIYGATDIYVSGDYVVIKSIGRPDHKSPYYLGTQWESTLYVNDTRAGFHANPSAISSQNYTFKIPLHPASAAVKTDTPLGPIGVSLNGVPFFNQYAAGRSPLTNEVVSFDLYGGHPAQSNNYHYHVEPTYLTSTKGSNALLGFLLDGYPVYGPVENGATISNANLDAYHGHTSVTVDFPAGIYHYHITSADPYINGNGFYGTPGTVSQ
jgi:hypothetical protein